MRHAFLAMGLAGCIDVELPIHLDLVHDQPDDVARVEVWVDAGDVDVQAGEEPAIERRLRWQGDVPPESNIQETGGTIVIDGRCPPRAVGCAVDVSVIAPRDAIVEVFTGGGDVSVTGLSGDVFVDTAAGVVDLELLSGDVVAYTADGDVRGRDLASGQVKIDAVGPVDLAFIAATSVDLRATKDVTLEVPSGSYRLELSADAGEIVVEDVLDDASSPYHLSARAVAGDVEVSGH